MGAHADGQGKVGGNRGGRVQTISEGLLGPIVFVHSDRHRLLERLRCTQKIILLLHDLVCVGWAGEQFFYERRDTVSRKLLQNVPEGRLLHQFRPVVLDIDRELLVVQNRLDQERLSQIASLRDSRLVFLG